MPPDLTSLDELDEQVLELVVKDGDTRIDSQFAAMESTRGSAYTVAGLAIAGATAAVGTALAAARAAPPDWSVAAVAGGFALIEGVAAALAIDAARPGRQRHIPGNEPAEWARGSGPMTYKEALLERARVLQVMLDVNDGVAAATVGRLLASLGVAGAGVVLGALAVVLLLVG